ncbi:MAG: hypothetical protein QXQ18_02150 [Candidatus Aenigmatarchaeota archaeon]
MSLEILYLPAAISIGLGISYTILKINGRGYDLFGKKFGFRPTDGLAVKDLKEAQRYLMEEINQLNSLINYYNKNSKGSGAIIDLVYEVELLKRRLEDLKASIIKG